MSPSELPRSMGSGSITPPVRPPGSDDAPENRPPSGRFFALRAGRALVFGFIVVALVAWLVTLPGVVAAVGLGAPLAWLGARRRLLIVPILATLVAAAVGAFAGVLYFGGGAVTARLLSGLLAAVAVAPWLVVVQLVLWGRSHRPPDASA